MNYLLITDFFFFFLVCKSKQRLFIKREEEQAREKQLKDLNRTQPLFRMQMIMTRKAAIQLIHDFEIHSACL